MLKNIPKIYKKHIYSKNITYDSSKLSFIYNFHYSRVTKGLRIIFVLKFLNYSYLGVMYYHQMLKAMPKGQVFTISSGHFSAFKQVQVSVS